MRKVSQAKLKHRRRSKWTVEAYHTRWKCQYHIVFIPKYRKKVLYGKVLAIPPFGASSNIALWRANIKPPVELMVMTRDYDRK